MAVSNVSPRINPSSPFENFTATPLVEPFTDPVSPVADGMDAPTRTATPPAPRFTWPVGPSAPQTNAPSATEALFTPSIDDWRSPRINPYDDARLPPNDSLSWRDKDRFVLANSTRRRNKKADAAAGTAFAAGSIAVVGGLTAITFGAAVPVFLAGLALVGVTGAAGYRMGGSKPDGLRKHVFAEVDKGISRKTSENIVKDLKHAGIYKSGRTRTLMQVQNLAETVGYNCGIPAASKDKIAAIIRFHDADVGWRESVRECMIAYKDEFKRKNRPSIRRRRTDPDADGQWKAVMSFKNELLLLHGALPSRRQLAREWISTRRSGTTDTAQQLAFDNMLQSLTKQANT